MLKGKIKITIALALLPSSLLILSGCGDNVDEHHEDMHNGDAGEMYGEGAAHHDQHERASAMNEAPSDARQVTVAATDFAFDPAEITAYPGEKLHVQLNNKGTSTHMWEVEGVSGTHAHAPMGTSDSVTFTAPEEPGEYNIYCGVAGHEAKGMVGTLIVRGKR